MEDDELFELISENKNMSKSLAEYSGQRSTSITCAKRLGEFLGAKTLEGKGSESEYFEYYYTK